MDAQTITMAVGFLGLAFLHFLPGPNRLRQEQTERVEGIGSRLTALELKVAAEHPVFLEKLDRLKGALESLTTELQGMRHEFHSFRKEFPRG